MKWPLWPLNLLQLKCRCCSLRPRKSACILLVTPTIQVHRLSWLPMGIALASWASELQNEEPLQWKPKPERTRPWKYEDNTHIVWDVPESVTNLEAMFYSKKIKGLDDTETQIQSLALRAVMQGTSGKEASHALSISFFNFKMGYNSYKSVWGDKINTVWKHVLHYMVQYRH